MDDVTLEDVRESTSAFALEGPEAEAVLKASLGGAPDVAPHSHISIGEASIYRSTLSGSPGFWIGGPAEVRDKLVAAGAVVCTEDDLEVARVENRVPALDADYFDSNIPHETQQLQIVSFTKGCYTGQEIVERVRSQGRVNRLLCPIEIDAEAPPHDDAVSFGDKEVGKATSLVVSPQSGKIAGFAILRREAAETGAAITVGGSPGRVLAWTD
jgi:folate-binding protein YgfZ